MTPIVMTILRRELVEQHRWGLVCKALRMALHEAGIKPTFIPSEPFEKRMDLLEATRLANQELAKRDLSFVFALNDKDEQYVGFTLCRDVVVVTDEQPCEGLVEYLQRRRREDTALWQFRPISQLSDEDLYYGMIVIKQEKPTHLPIIE